MTTMTLPQPLPAIPWRCNGGINPLIRTEEELADCCETEAEFKEAIRWMKIHLECHHKVTSGELMLATPAEICKRYRESLSMSRRPEILPGITTAAQLLAKHGNLHCLAECDSIRDLQRCFALMGNVNEFNTSRVSVAFGRFNRVAYYSVDNPNTGRDAFTYEIGKECSEVVYITFRCLYLTKVLTPDWRHFVEYTPDDFQSDCRILARATRADESDCVEADEHRVKWRLWWD